MIRRRTRALVAGAVLMAATMGSTACSAFGFNGIQDIPLPGGPELGAHPYTVVVRFDDALSLVPHSAVKVHNVPVGTVREIRLLGNGWQDGWTAEVVLAINDNVTLPENAVARIRQTSLLGEKFVELAAPSDLAKERSGTAPVHIPKSARLSDGAVIPVSRTDTGVEVEQILGALSLLLNGGGLKQLHTITGELSRVFSGNEQEIEAFLNSLNKLVTQLDANRRAITEALDAMDRLTTRLAERTEQISTALTEISPGLATLTDQRTQLVRMLGALDELSRVAVNTLRKSTQNMIADLKALAPILRRLVQAGDALPKALEILPTFPFTNAVLDAIKGDYMNVFLDMAPSEGFEQPIPLLDPPRDLTPMDPPTGGEN